MKFSSERVATTLEQTPVLPGEMGPYDTADDFVVKWFDAVVAYSDVFIKRGQLPTQCLSQPDRLQESTLDLEQGELTGRIRSLKKWADENAVDVDRVKILEGIDGLWQEF